MKILKTSLILTIIFLISAYIRIPYISNEVKSNNLSSIYMLTTLEIWATRGISKCSFSPILTWWNEGDKYISYYKRLEDKEGNNYYVSHPPFAMLFTYFIFQIFHIFPNQLSLQIINLLLHFISAIFVYLIILNYFKKSWNKIFIPALLAYIAFIFTPVLLYIHTFHFFSEMFVLPIWLIGILVMMKLLKSTEQFSLTKLLLTGMLVFLIIYTEWLGVFFSFTICIICFIYRKESKKYLLLLKTIIISSTAAILLILFQYGRINGLGKLFYSLALRFSERSGFFGDKYSDQSLSIFNPDSYILFLKQIHNTLIGFGYVFLAIAVITIILKKRKFNFRLSLKNNLLLLSLLPVLIHFFVFFNANVICYTYMAKLGIPVSLGFGIVSNNLLQSVPLYYKKLVVYGLFLVSFLVILISYNSFLEKTSQTSNDNYLIEISNIIKKNSGKDEAVFIKLNSEAYDTPIVFLPYAAKRNLMNAENVDDAKEILIKKNKTKGVFFTFKPVKDKFSVVHFNNL